jgi:hypothetical protein
MWGREWVRATLALMLLISPAAAQETEEPPPPELLEFLADWETEEGRWIDPTRLDELPIEENEGGEDEDHEKNAT